MAENIKYFMFSLSQLQFQKKVDKQLSRDYVNRYVFQNGQKKQYTEIIDDSSKSKYPDAVMVAYGDISTMRYN